jgi:hypothetical protein
VLETFFLNLFYGGKLKAMPPKLLSDDGRHIVIRPLAYVPEREIERYARARDFPIIPCDLCGSQPNLQREVVGRMLQAWEREHPGRVESIFAALCDTAVSHLADPRAYDFRGLDQRRGGESRGAANPLHELEPRDAAFVYAARAAAAATGVAGTTAEVDADDDVDAGDDADAGDDHEPAQATDAVQSPGARDRARNGGDAR